VTGEWRDRIRPSYSEPVTGEPRLEWGRLAAFDLTRAAHMPADLVSRLAGRTGVARPGGGFELAGTINAHPGHVRSDEAKRPFGAIFALAVASRTAATAAAARQQWP
jgi:hypothetical protein